MHFHIAVRAKLYWSIFLGKYFCTIGQGIELSRSLNLYHLITSEGTQKILFTFQIYRTDCWEDPRCCGWPTRFQNVWTVLEYRKDTCIAAGIEHIERLCTADQKNLIIWLKKVCVFFTSVSNIYWELLYPSHLHFKFLPYINRWIEVWYLYPFFPFSYPRRLKGIIDIDNL
jgi:hypothetical protein